MQIIRKDLNINLDFDAEILYKWYYIILDFNING